MSHLTHPTRRLALTALVAMATPFAHAQGPSLTAPPVLTPDPRIEPGSLTLEGRTLDYQRAGAGPGIVIVHGGADASPWKAIQLRLARRQTVVVVTLAALENTLPAPAAGAERSAASSAQALRQLIAALKFERPYLVGNDTGAVIAYAFARAQPASVRGVMLLDALVPGLEPWRTPTRDSSRSWTTDARSNAAARDPTETPLVLALGEQSPNAAQIAVHSVALRDHGWSRVETTLMPRAARDLVAEQPDMVATLIERQVQ